MVTYGGGLGKDHDHDNLPLVLTGRGNGLFNLGRNVLELRQRQIWLRFNPSAQPFPPHSAAPSTMPL